jgi:hypothetical protein
MKLLIMQFSPASLHILPFRSKYSSQHLFSNTLNQRPSLSVRDQLSHPYKATCAVNFFNILIFKFSEMRGKTKHSEQMAAIIP